MVGRVTLTADALLFDLDGTLIDSSDSVVRSWLRWAVEFGVDPSHLADAHGRTSAAIVADLMPPDQVERALTRIDELELEDAVTVCAMPGAADLIDGLPTAQWAIVTSGNAPLAAARVGAAGIAQPTLLITADDVVHGKPNPEPFLLGAAKLGVEPERCLVFEDAPSGIAAARAAGMAVVGVTSTYPADRLDADLHVASPAELHVEPGDVVRVMATS